MGYGYGIINGKEVGYNVSATCEHPGCNEKIDRGLAYACGGEHGAGDGYCDGYYCYEHLIMTKKKGQLCPACYEAYAQTDEGKQEKKELQEMIAGLRYRCGKN